MPDPMGNSTATNGERGPISPEAIEEYKRKVEDVAQRARAFIEDNPGTALIGAAAIGFLFARLVRRR